MDCIFSIVVLINWHFIFLFSLTVFIDCDWRLRHPRAVKFICSHGEFLKNTGSFPTLWTAAICPACETQRKAICPKAVQKNKGMPGKSPPVPWGVKVRAQGEDGSKGSAGDDTKVSSSIFTIKNCTSHTNSSKNTFASSLLATEQATFLCAHKEYQAYFLFWDF